MDDVASARSENANLRKIRERLLLWNVKDNPLAPLSNEQQDAIDILTQILSDDSSLEEVDESVEKHTSISSLLSKDKSKNDEKIISPAIPSESLKELIKLPENRGIETTNDFLFWYDKVNNEIHDHKNDIYKKFFNELKCRKDECDEILERTNMGLQKLDDLKSEYEFVSNKTSSLNTASEKLLREQSDLNAVCTEIGRRLRYFKQADQLSQRLQSPTLSVSSDSFKELLNEIDACLHYLMENSKFKESSSYIIKYKHCLSKAITLMRNYVVQTLTQATEQILSSQKASTTGSSDKSTSEIAFALFYGKFHSTAVKVKRISSIIEERCCNQNGNINYNNSIIEYEQLLSELHQCYLQHRANVMSPAVDNSIKDLKSNNKGDHCTLMRNACAFLVHVCQDEYRLFYQFFSIPTDQLNSYLEGLCTILYDTLRPYIIHINHLETLAEICSILRVEMIEEHVNQNPESLEAFGRVVNQLLQDVQERLVFRAHLYLQSDILNYNPSVGDLAYPEKLEMMESIALSLQESQMLKRSDSKSSIVSSTSSAIQDTESVDSTMVFRGRSINSPADLHGMWYPTVRRTLVFLSRLYRCVDRPIFQGLSQEALKYCIQSVSNASAKISTTKSIIDGELFEIKHLLILREQIAPFRVDFTIKETSLDFSKVKTAAFGLIQKRKQLFALGTNNALLEFLLEGTPEVKEHLIDSRKDVDRQLKHVCEQFIRDSVQLLIGPILKFIEKAQNLLTLAETTQNESNKINYALRQSPWASPQQISSYVQESQRNIKNKLSGLQRSMELYLSNKDTEFIIFRPIRNNIISYFVKLEQLLTTNGYTKDDLIISGCPSAEQISVLLSSASMMAVAESSSSTTTRKISTASSIGGSVVNKENCNKKMNDEEKVDSNEPKLLGTKNDNDEKTTT